MKSIEVIAGRIGHSNLEEVGNKQVRYYDTYKPCTNVGFKFVITIERTSHGIRGYSCGFNPRKENPWIQNKVGSTFFLNADPKMPTLDLAIDTVVGEVAKMIYQDKITQNLDWTLTWDEIYTAWLNKIQPTATKVIPMVSIGRQPVGPTPEPLGITSFSKTEPDRLLTVDEGISTNVLAPALPWSQLPTETEANVQMGVDAATPEPVAVGE